MAVASSVIAVAIARQGRLNSATVLDIKYTAKKVQKKAVVLYVSRLTGVRLCQLSVGKLLIYLRIQNPMFCFFLKGQGGRQLAE